MLKTEHEIKASKDMIEIVKQLSNLCNSMGSANYLIPAFAEQLHKEHRCIQADMITVLLKGMFEWARECIDRKAIDPRNEFAIKLVLTRLGAENEDEYGPLFGVVDRYHALNKHHNGIDSHLSCGTY